MLWSPLNDPAGPTRRPGHQNKAQARSKVYPLCNSACPPFCVCPPLWETEVAKRETHPMIYAVQSVFARVPMQICAARFLAILLIRFTILAFSFTFSSFALWFLQFSVQNSIWNGNSDNVYHCFWITTAADTLEINAWNCLCLPSSWLSCGVVWWVLRATQEATVQPSGSQLRWALSRAVLCLLVQWPSTHSYNCLDPTIHCTLYAATTQTVAPPYACRKNSWAVAGIPA